VEVSREAHLAVDADGTTPALLHLTFDEVCGHRLLFDDGVLCWPPLLPIALVSPSMVVCYTGCAYILRYCISTWQNKPFSRRAFYT